MFYHDLFTPRGLTGPEIVVYISFYFQYFDYKIKSLYLNTLSIQALGIHLALTHKKTTQKKNGKQRLK
jgi:hypothetical protein